MINFKMLATQLLEKFERLTPYDRYKWFLSQYYLATLKLGKENFTQTDCSGILSGALYLSGFNIRCTAQFFYDHIFIQEWDHYHTGLSYGVGFVYNVKEHCVDHLMPHIENGVYLNVTDKVELMNIKGTEKYYDNESRVMQFRTTSEKTLSAFSVSLLAATETDKEIAELWGV